MKYPRRAAAAVSIAAVMAASVLVGPAPLLLAGSETPPESKGVSIEALEATVQQETLDVVGAATFDGLWELVGTDRQGDAYWSYRADILNASILRPSADDDRLIFSIRLADDYGPAPGAEDALGHVHYNWSFDVVDGDTRSGFMLQAFTTGWSNGDLDPTFRLIPRNAITNTLGHEQAISWQDIDGSIDERYVRFEVPMQIIGVQAGLLITQDADPGGTRAVRTVMGFQGRFWNYRLTPQLQDGLDRMYVSDYLVPVPTAQLGIAPAGTPLGQVPLTATATVGPDGRFAGSVGLSGVPSGEYILAARACFGAENCARAGTSFER